MHNANGIGLAANQVGSLQRVVVVDISGTDEGKDSKPVVLVNPEVVREEGLVTMEEGCLSLPDLHDEVERAERVTVRFRDLEFKQQEMTVDGILARVFQHEIDHLNGALFFDHLGAVRRRLLNGRLNKLKRGEVEVFYPAVGAIYVAPAPGAQRSRAAMEERRESMTGSA
jgi:peptide deformylase